MSSPALPPTKPYFVRALHQWCEDNGYTPYLTVAVDSRTAVPREYVKDGEITLNISYSATSRLIIENDSVAFTARFNGQARELWIPMNRVAAIYARENGVGMGFDVEEPPLAPVPTETLGSADNAEKPAAAKRPSHLQRVK